MNNKNIITKQADIIKNFLLCTYVCSVSHRKSCTIKGGQVTKPIVKNML